MFTENQVRQFYVVPTGNADTTNVKEPTKIVTGTSGTYPADLKALADGACQFVVAPAGDEAYLMYKGPLDGPQRSDLIKKCNVIDVRFTDAADMVHKNKKAVLTLDSSLISSSTVAEGEYVLNIEIKNYIALGYNSTKVKFATVVSDGNTSPSDFYKKLALNIAKNFKRESAPLVSVGISTAATGASPVLVGSSSWDSTTAAAAIVIEEVAQPWRLGAAKVEYVDFEVYPSMINEKAWGKVQFAGSAKYTDGTASSATITAGGTQPNSKAVADMEYFFHKERGDVYGFAGFPNNIDTVYQVVPGFADGYSMVDIHYYFEGNSHNVGHSEKTLTVVGSKANLKRLFGSAATTGQSATAATGLYAFLEGTGVEIKTSTSW